MSENKVNNLLGVSMDKIKEMVDVNTVIGDPITTPDGVTLIPVSRLSFGFGCGGGQQFVGQKQLGFENGLVGNEIFFPVHGKNDVVVFVYPDNAALSLIHI